MLLYIAVQGERKVIEIKNLNYQIEEKILFENANANIKCGKYILCGNNGIGKTSLLNIITGYIKTDCNIKVDSHYMYISQSPKLIDNLTVEENVIFFNAKNSQFILNTLIKKNININNKVGSLSGGQKQLTYLLVTLITDYHLYIIDEPLNNLDDDNVDLIVYLINQKDNVLIVDHLFSFDYEMIEIKERKIICDF